MLWFLKCKLSVEWEASFTLLTPSLRPDTLVNDYKYTAFEYQPSTISVNVSKMQHVIKNSIKVLKCSIWIHLINITNENSTECDQAKLCFKVWPEWIYPVSQYKIRQCAINIISRNVRPLCCVDVQSLSCIFNPVSVKVTTVLPI